MISISLTIKEMLAEKTRVLLTLFAVAWGTASIAGMLAVGEGLRSSFGHAMNNAGPGLLYVMTDKTSHGYHGIAAKAPVYITPDDLAAAKQTIGDQATLLGEYQFKGLPLTHNRHNARYYDGRAVSDHYGELRAIHIDTPGRFINHVDQTQKRRVVVLGQKVATWLFPKGHALGQHVTLGRWPFEVVGVASKKIQFASFGSSDDYQIWIPQTTYESLSQNRHYNDWLIQAKNPDNNVAIAKQLSHLIAKRHSVDPNDAAVVTTVNLYEYQQKSDEVFTGMQIFLRLVGSITLLVAGLGVANVMFVTVRRATRLIGVQMAIGAQSRHILLHYLLQSLFITLTGGIIGIAGATVIVTVINHIPIHSDVFSMIGKPHPELSGVVLIATVVILSLIGLVAGFLPARKAARINPVEALMYE